MGGPNVLFSVHDEIEILDARLCSFVHLDGLDELNN